LHLRIDNADERLTPIGREAGLVTDDRWSLFQRKRLQKEAVLRLLGTTRALWLKRPEARIAQLQEELTRLVGEPLVREVLTTVETEVKYEGYITQQARQIRHLKDSERRPIPGDFSFSQIPGLSREIRDKLERVRPATLGQASRIPGVTPAAIAVLDVYLSVVPGKQ
jgi:tRNA uridine 5-carboxymethylaminomethyl modification enzyme